MLFDEPFAGVDPINVGELQRQIARLKERGLGVLITDHNVQDTLRICDRAYIIAQGQILEEGTPRAIAESERARSVYLGERFRLTTERACADTWTPRGRSLSGRSFGHGRPRRLGCQAPASGSGAGRRGATPRYRSSTGPATALRNPVASDRAAAPRPAARISRTVYAGSHAKNAPHPEGIHRRTSGPPRTPGERLHDTRQPHQTRLEKSSRPAQNPPNFLGNPCRRATLRASASGRRFPAVGSLARSLM